MAWLMYIPMLQIVCGGVLIIMGGRWLVFNAVALADDGHARRLSRGVGRPKLRPKRQMVTGLMMVVAGAVLFFTWEIANEMLLPLARGTSP